MWMFDIKVCNIFSLNNIVMFCSVLRARTFFITNKRNAQNVEKRNFKVHEIVLV